MTPPSTPDAPPSLSTLELQLKRIQKEIEERRPLEEDTGVHRINTRALAQQVETAIAAHNAAEAAALRRALARWGVIIGGIASIIATVAVAVVRAIPAPETTAVQTSVEQQRERLDTVEQQGERIEAVEVKLGDIGQALRDLAAKVDELARPEPPSEPEPEPRRRRKPPAPAPR